MAHAWNNNTVLTFISINITDKASHEEMIFSRLEANAEVMLKTALILGTVFLVIICGLCGLMCFRDLMRRREMMGLKADALHRKRIQDAVRSKIAEMEGLEDSHSLKWYMEQRNPIVQFEGIEESTPDISANQSVTVLYSLGEDGDLSSLKKIELNLQALLGDANGTPQPQSPGTSPTIGSAGPSHWFYSNPNRSRHCSISGQSSPSQVPNQNSLGIDHSLLISEDGSSFASPLGVTDASQNIAKSYL